MGCNCGKRAGARRATFYTVTFPDDTTRNYMTDIEAAAACTAAYTAVGRPCPADAIAANYTTATPSATR